MVAGRCSFTKPIDDRFTAGMHLCLGLFTNTIWGKLFSHLPIPLNPNISENEFDLVDGNAETKDSKKRKRETV